jgi:hypothetical protein
MSNGGPSVSSFGAVRDLNTSNAGPVEIAQQKAAVLASIGRIFCQEKRSER